MDIDLDKVLKTIESASGPSRSIDEMMARIGGYTPLGAVDIKGRPLWQSPYEANPWAVPWFTQYIDTTKKLADYLTEGLPVALSFSPPKAVIWKCEVCYAATPSLALCGAVVNFMKIKHGHSA